MELVVAVMAGVQGGHRDVSGGITEVSDKYFPASDSLQWFPTALRIKPTLLTSAYKSLHAPAPACL